MDYFNNSSSTGYKTDHTRYDEGLRNYMLHIYKNMSIALGITGLVAFFASSSQAIMSMIYVMKGNAIVGMAPLGWLVTLAPLGIALMFGFGMTRMKYESARNLLWLYAGLMGLSLTSVFVVYTGASIARVFFITASIFGGMSLYGYTTKKDLTSMGSFLIMGVFGILVASLVNMFLRSPGLYFALSFLSVIIFTGLTAYDTQRLKSVYYQYGGNNEMAAKISIVGALGLYMNFIQIFINLLQFFGDRRSE
jgi:FtsH-binding integral membrane protein